MQALDLYDEFRTLTSILALVTTMNNKVPKITKDLQSTAVDYHGRCRYNDRGEEIYSIRLFLHSLARLLVQNHEVIATTVREGWESDVTSPHAGEITAISNPRRDENHHEGSDSPIVVLTNARGSYWKEIRTNGWELLDK